MDAFLSRQGDPAYTSATRVFNLASPARPALAVTARTVEDVRAALRHARAEGLGVRVHSTGHSSGGDAPMTGALLVRTQLAGQVEVDPVARVARVPAGTTWETVLAAVAPYGLVPPHGSAGTVGVVGYLLRGGISYYGRKVGLAANSVRAVELVTAEGDTVRADAATEQDLFWALRGGGGGFGVVTAIEVALFPASTVVTGATFWSAEHAGRLLPVWLKWTQDAPPEASTSLRFLNFPPLPDVPPVLSAGPVFAVDGVVVGTAGDDPTRAEQQAAELVEPLRAVAEPLLDEWQTTSPTSVLGIHMDPPDPVPYRGDHFLIDEPGEAGTAELLAVLGADSGSPMVVSGLRQLGGAIATPNPDGGVLNHLDARFVYSGTAVPEAGLTDAAISAYFARVRTALAPWDTGRTAPTFVESHEQPQGHLDPADVAAVDRVRARIDPTGLFAGDITPNASAGTRREQW
ncbi:oxidoreductase [Actinophytocola xinjiangensis]|uniref:Oxidoreductase n=1 Tax=Actinophytocola xinjiangensis TaxID=485602 RepID=A0A7Z1B064_9PSEU|nr:FAD-dependent oxidoreductase [Actinophytocola xinjiangensis]OLF12966.1 oxidoreductase [Actinophytocola xinjiangensis]